MASPAIARQEALWDWGFAFRDNTKKKYFSIIRIAERQHLTFKPLSSMIGIKIALTFITISTLAPAFGQRSAINGVVVLQNSLYFTGKREYIEHAQVTARYANPQLTNPAGQFRLIFTRTPEKTTVTFDVRKDNLVVVNFDKLTAVAGQAEPIEIDMAEPNMVAKLRDSIFHVGGQKAMKALQGDMEATRRELTRQTLIDRGESKKIDSLRQRTAYLEQRLSEINEEASQLADDYARQNLDNLSDDAQMALKLFLDGQIEKAFMLLRPAVRVDRIIARRDTIKSMQAIDKKETIETLGDLNLKAHFAILQNLPDSAALYYRQMLLIDSNSFDARFSIAYFFQNENQFDSAIYYYRTALHLRISNTEKARTLNNLGLVLFNHSGSDSATVVLLEGLKLDKEAGEKNGRYDYANIYRIQNNLGMISEHNWKIKEAESYYLEAIVSNNQIATRDSAQFLQNCSEIYNNLGLFYKRLGKLDKAIGSLKKALKFNANILDKSDKDMLLQAAIETDLGMIYVQLDSLPTAKPYLLSAIDSFWKINAARHNIYEYEWTLGVVNLCGYYEKSGQLDSVGILMNQVIDIRTKLANIDFYHYGDRLAHALKLHGTFFLIYRKDPDSAQFNLQKGLELYKKLAEINFERHKEEIGETLILLSEVHELKGNILAAKVVLVEALPIEEDMAKKIPDLFFRNLYPIYSDLCLIYCQLNEVAHMKETFSRAISFIDSFKPEKDSIIAQVKAQIYVGYSECLYNIHEDDSAEKYARKALVFFNRPTKSVSVKSLEYIARSKAILGYIQISESNKSDGLKLLEEALDFMKKLPQGVQQQHVGEMRQVEEIIKANKAIK